MYQKFPVESEVVGLCKIMIWQTKYPKQRLTIVQLSTDTVTNEMQVYKA